MWHGAGELVVVSPDVGGVARARAFAKKLNDAPLAIVDKRRSAHNVSEVMNLIGDVRGKVRGRVAVRRMTCGEKLYPFEGGSRDKIRSGVWRCAE